MAAAPGRVSIHAPVQGATKRGAVPQGDRGGFNPRTRAGCDASTSSSSVAMWKFQSTHPCRVRRMAGQGQGDRRGFNPRTRAGCDSFRATCPPSPSRFNPRTRAGCDTSPPARPPAISCFNPRTRAGCDTTVEDANRIIREFQSTHPCRVRLSPRRITSRRRSFNPRTRAGCDVGDEAFQFPD